MIVFRIVMVCIVCRDSCSYLTVAGFESQLEALLDYQNHVKGKSRFKNQQWHSNKRKPELFLVYNAKWFY